MDDQPRARRVSDMDPSAMSKAILQMNAPRVRHGRSASSGGGLRQHHHHRPTIRRAGHSRGNSSSAGLDDWTKGVFLRVDAAAASGHHVGPTGGLGVVEMMPTSGADTAAQECLQHSGGTALGAYATSLQHSGYSNSDTSNSSPGAVDCWRAGPTEAADIPGISPSKPQRGADTGE